MGQISIIVNGKKEVSEIPDEMLLVNFLREKLRLTGTHIGCDTSQCGACVVNINGKSVKSCSMLAQQANNSEITTIEGIGTSKNLHPIQKAFKNNHGLQCGFCTPGMIMSALDLINKNENLDDETIRIGINGNLCRCTGYHNIVKSILQASREMKK